MKKVVVGKFKTKEAALETWLKGAGITQTQLAKEIDFDDGNFSKIATNLLEPSKIFMKSLMMYTGYGWDALFELDRKATSEDTDK
jgi:hypothetical protein